MTKKPSETMQGMSWLRNFKPEEQHTAELLVDTIRIVSSTAFRAHMIEFLSSAISDIPSPAVVYPIRELPDYLKKGRRQTEDELGVEVAPDGDIIQLRPLDDPFEQLPGSEGIVGNIIRDVIGHEPDEEVASSPRELEELRRIKPRSVILVDDYSGTGTRVAGYVDSWMKHPTIRSWYSYGRIRFYVVLLAASGAALAKLSEHPRITDIRYRELAIDFDSAPWSDDERAAITELCQKYAYNKRWELGYKSAAGLMVMQHTVPNNLPAILWQATGRRRANWNSLFAHRRIDPTLQIELDDYKLEVDAVQIANSMGQLKLGLALSEQPNPTVRMILLVLAAVAQRNRSPEKISEILHTSVLTAENTVEACKALGLLDQQGRLTDPGRNELRHARVRGDEIPSTRLYGSSKPYYPTQLRGVSEV